MIGFRTMAGKRYALELVSETQATARNNWAESELSSDQL